MMKLRPTPEVFGHATFCDDIRMEVGNKLTFVGCYSGFMFLNSEFPATIPRFCVAVQYSQARGKVILPIKFVIFLPGDLDDKPSLEFGGEIDENEMAKREANTVSLGASPDFVTVTAQIGISNLVLREPGLMRVRAVRGDEFVRLGTLGISRAPS
jgi:hypothetical protein